MIRSGFLKFVLEFLSFLEVFIGDLFSRDNRVRSDL